MDPKKKTYHIPKIIHQVWIGPKPAPVRWMKTWSEMNPSWEYRLWTDHNLPSLKNQRQFDAINTFNGKTDILRPEILYKYGGIYIDADCECIRSLDDDLRRHKFFTCYENEVERAGLVACGIIGCRPHHPLMRNMIQALGNIKDPNKGSAWAVVGPVFFTTVLRYYCLDHSDIAILPSHSFLPIHYEGQKYSGSGKVYAIHHWYTTEIERKERKKNPEQKSN